jgi:DNA-binding NtrC family response regulator
VRELKNAVEHAVIMAREDVIGVEHLPSTLLERAPAPKKKPVVRGLTELRDEWLAPFEARYLSELLAESGGSVRRAAVAAKVDAVTLYRLLKKRNVRFGRAVR